MNRQWSKLSRQAICVAALGCGFGAAQAQQDFDDREPGGVAAIDAVAGASTPAFAAATVNDSRTWLQTGVASWYGDRFHGRKTASGEAFDMNALTAAHPKLAFGSWVRVRNLFNGRSVDVRINDRGPHIKQRVIDLSRAAAEALGLAGQGTRQVEITLLDTLR